MEPPGIQVAAAKKKEVSVLADATIYDAPF